MKNRQFWTLFAVILIIGFIAIYNLNIISDRTLNMHQSIVELGRDVYAIKDIVY